MSSPPTATVLVLCAAPPRPAAGGGQRLGRKEKSDIARAECRAAAEACDGAISYAWATARGQCALHGGDGSAP
eukprot:gene54905-27589_t